MNTEAYVCTKQAARILGISYKTLEKARIGYGVFNPPYHRFGRMVRYNVAELLEYAKGFQQAA